MEETEHIEEETAQELRERIGIKFNYLPSTLCPVSLSPVDAEVERELAGALQCEPSELVLAGASERVRKAMLSPSEVLRVKPCEEGKKDWNYLEDCVTEAWVLAYKNWILVLLELEDRKILIKPATHRECCFALLTRRLED